MSGDVEYILMQQKVPDSKAPGGYSIFMIARSIDRAPLPSDNKSTVGPGFAVVGTPGSPSDVARTKVKVLLSRL